MFESASRIRHPGVAAVFAVGEDAGGGLYIVQEFVKGRPLSDLMAGDGAPDPPTFIHRSHQTIDGDLTSEQTIVSIPIHWRAGCDLLALAIRVRSTELNPGYDWMCHPESKYATDCPRGGEEHAHPQPYPLGDTSES